MKTMHTRSGAPTTDVASGASFLMTYGILAALIRKGVLTAQEAAAVAVEAADRTRTGTEDQPGWERSGGAAADACETLAGWLLRQA